MNNYLLTALFIMLSSSLSGQQINKEFLIRERYLNIPVSTGQTRQKVCFISGSDTLTCSVIRISDGNPDYWVFKDISAMKGKKLTLAFTKEARGIEMIYQSAIFAGEDSLYNEKNRPQLHFTSRRGWNNDPNGLVYHDGEYHLFYQHNPFENQWENMHWGHAVSKDLLHWEELDDALYPDRLGTMFSGSAVIDKDNTAGWGENTMVAFYTAAGKKMTQNVAYSRDNGRTFVKYEDNPILGPDRDPKVFWHEPAKTWVMVLYNDNYFAIYNSQDLKTWDYKSMVKGFYECPELFELAIDNNDDNKKWVMYGASGTYMIGTFDGHTFSPEGGKYSYSAGSQYAAQTYNNAPGNRRIQIGWGRIEQPGMPFNQMMLFPAELTLRTTPEGVRLFCQPIEEIERLHGKTHSWQNMTAAEANEKLSDINSELLHVRMNVEIVSGLELEVQFGGNTVLRYDGNYNSFNGTHYLCDKPGNFLFDIELLIDRTSVEAWIGKGKLFISEGLKKERSAERLKTGGNVKIHSLEIHEMNPIWPPKQ